MIQTHFLISPRTRILWALTVSLAWLLSAFPAGVSAERPQVTNSAPHGPCEEDKVEAESKSPNHHSRLSGAVEGRPRRL